MIEVINIAISQLVGVNLYIVFYKGVCKYIYARSEKEAEEYLSALSSMLDAKEPEVKK